MTQRQHAITEALAQIDAQIHDAEAVFERDLFGAGLSFEEIAEMVRMYREIRVADRPRIIAQIHRVFDGLDVTGS